jgi:hypothetical protein
VVTLTLALGSQRTVDRNALVRGLPVVESLAVVLGVDALLSRRYDRLLPD